MEWMLVLLLFLLGLSVGSFLNVVIIRTIAGESPMKGRSKCPHCGKKIEWYRNIPLLSFLFLGGRCAKCKTKISWQYPVVELLSGLLFVWWYVIGRGFFLLVGSPLAYVQPIFWLGVGVLLLLVMVFDLRYGVIPDWLNLMMLGWVLGYRVGLVSSGVMMWGDFGRAVLSGMMLMGFFYFLVWITKGKGFGMGDVKLAPALGLLLGWPKILVGVMGAFVSGAVVAVGLIWLGRKRFGQTMPFGPFLVLGVIIALVWGSEVWNWYMGLIW